MADLISRAAAIDAHKRAAYWQDAERKIAELPAVDATPVVHGKWQWLSSTYDRTPCEMRYLCSECHHETITHSVPPWEKYCPNCGAKMDGERREYGENPDTKRE